MLEHSFIVTLSLEQFCSFATCFCLVPGSHGIVSLLAGSCTCVIVGAAGVLLVIAVLGGKADGVVVHGIGQVSGHLRQAKGIVGGGSLQREIVLKGMPSLLPVLQFHLQDRASLTGNSVDLLQTKPELFYKHTHIHSYYRARLLMQKGSDSCARTS